MKLQRVTDKAAIGLSCICVLHCLALPLLLILLPSMAFLADEGLVHRLLLVAIIPISLVAVIMGYLKHKRRRALYLAAVGLALLVLSAVVGHDFGHVIETVLTVIGSVLVVLAHLKNAWDSKQHGMAMQPAATDR